MFHIIDDEEQIRNLVKALIVRTGHEALCFESGTQYLEYLNNPDFIPPIAVLTDVTMPGINGYDLAVEIRNNLPFQKIILITAYADEEHHRFAASQLCYTLNKPYHAETLIALITALIACENEHRGSNDKIGAFHQCEFGIDHNCPFHYPDKQSISKP
ncbi:nitrogen assimilation regulatory protein [Mariprofundus micogutta]|uniref:Nitrogen assimilation regulatory protein n=1 Tax=Mariprofundus micogutta TaxID=1921010 RepID=A0A1L8CL38_9PROT|nr:response regulator [Mariprofundus micogutta]GAV19559.1 nitrogen assimilation regulatory protein [Mariprofundus micogutta]